MTEVDPEAEKAALLTSQGLTQKDIANLLDLSQSTVSRRLNEARDARILESVCRLSKQRRSELMEEIHAPNLAQRLKEMSEGAELIQELLIFNSGASGKTRSRQEYERRTERFASQVATYLHNEVFPNIDHMGVTWGHTLRKVVDQLQAIRGRRRLKRPSFVPVCGDPPDVSLDPMRSSSLLVSQLTEAVQGKKPTELSLAGVAACIPGDFEKHEIETIYRFFARISAHGQIIGSDGRSGLVKDLDSFLTSVGTTSKIHDPWSYLPHETEEQHKRLKEVTLGNIAGIFLPKPDVTESDREFVCDINDRWTGVREEHLSSCAERARDERRAIGVVVLAFGSEKAAVVAKCIQQRMVSRLLIDQDLAAHLPEQLEILEKT